LDMVMDEGGGGWLLDRFGPHTNTRVQRGSNMGVGTNMGVEASMEDSSITEGTADSILHRIR